MSFSANILVAPYHLCPINIFLEQMRCTFDAHFNWVFLEALCINIMKQDRNS